MKLSHQKTPPFLTKKMEFFQRAKVFRLKSNHHNKYLTAEEDEQKVKQNRDKSSRTARWYYELVEGKPNVIRLRSCWSHRYLAATGDPFLLGMTGNKVIQSINKGPTLEWEPIKEGPYIKLKSHFGSYLKANPRVPPYRNSVTHVESGNWTVTDNMTLWIVDIVDIDYKSTTGDDDQATQVVEEDCKVSSLSTDEDSELNEETNSDEHQHIHPIELTMAKQTLKELKDTDFHTIQSSERGEKLDKALKLLISDSNPLSQDLHDLQDKLMTMKNEHSSASQELIEYSGFSTTMSKLKTELKRDAAKARELETFQAELHTKKAEREDLLKQLEEIQSVIKDAEKAEADNLADVEEVISRLGQKSQKLEEMKCEEETWQVNKTKAYTMLRTVEEEWEMVKTMFPDE